MNSTVDKYLIDGCGRCSKYQTPDCKVHHWHSELTLMRKILLGCGLSEVIKWGQPCYMHEGKNILLMSAFKEYCAISFFKGSLLKDTHTILASPGANSQATRQIRISDKKTIQTLNPIIAAYIREAIAIENTGQKVSFKKTPEPVPSELQNIFAKNPTLKTAFGALTPGRQRAYLFFSGAKQAKTRESRIEKYIPKILKGKGMND